MIQLPRLVCQPSRRHNDGAETYQNIPKSSVCATGSDITKALVTLFPNSMIKHYLGGILECHDGSIIGCFVSPHFYPINSTEQS